MHPVDFQVQVLRLFQEIWRQENYKLDNPKIKGTGFGFAFSMSGRLGNAKIQLCYFGYLIGKDLSHHLE